jgi:mxaL protein
MIRGFRALNWRFWCTLMAAGMLAAAICHPVVHLNRAVFRFLFVVDITQSMNARDYHLGGREVERLEYVKEAIRQTLLGLPCGSEAGLGLFTTKNTEILFEPIEVCEHLPIIIDVLEHIDWRMAWAADSYIAEGLYSALRQIRTRTAPMALAFFSDGQQTPEGTLPANFSGRPGEIPGVLVGVGDTQPVMIPKLDRDNNPVGFWENADISVPVSSTAYQNRLSEDVPAERPREGYYFSQVFEGRLKRLAGLTGLDYHRLRDVPALSRLVRSEKFAATRRAPTDLGPWLAMVSWVLLAASYLSRPSGIRKRLSD